MIPGADLSAAARELVERTTAAQNLPVCLTDAATLDQLRELLHSVGVQFTAGRSAAS